MVTQQIGYRKVLEVFCQLNHDEQSFCTVFLAICHVYMPQINITFDQYLQTYANCSPG